MYCYNQTNTPKPIFYNDLMNETFETSASKDKKKIFQTIKTCSLKYYKVH